MDTRGIVVTPQFRFDGSEFRFLGPPEINLEDLKYYLLYWDKIDFPDTDIFNVPTPPDAKFLIEEGVLYRRTIVPLGKSQGDVQAYVDVQLSALQEDNKEEPGCWSMAQTANILCLPEELSHETRAIEVELYGVPFPLENVSFEDILDFKDKRQAELMAFRAAMDDLYLEVINSADIPRAKIAAINRIEHALQDLNKVAGESWIKKGKSVIPDALIGYIAIEEALEKMEWIPEEVRFPLALAGTAIKYVRRITRKPQNLPAEIRAFAYRHNIERELRALGRRK